MSTQTNIAKLESFSRKVATESTFRTPPMNLDAEQALLGALLVNNLSFEKVSDFLKAEHFFDPSHQKIFYAMQRLIDRGQIASPVTLKNFFEKDQELEKIGGFQYITDLASSVINVINIEDYAHIIYENFLKRQLIDIGQHVVNDAYKHDLDKKSDNIIEDTEKKLFDLATYGNTKGGFEQLNIPLSKSLEIAHKAFHSDKSLTGYTTGLIELDMKLGGLQRSDLIILAGRPSMGKTALATNIAYNCAKAYMNSGGEEGGIVGFFSLEMSSEQLATRILADETRIASHLIRKGEISKDDFVKFGQASAVLSQLPFYIDDTPALSIAALRARARRLKRTHGLHLLVVDYLQLMRGSDTKNTENRVQEISDISRGLKAIAKELDIPVIALSQLSRAVETREDKKPQLSDLRESGSIEQDADVVMFVYREQYYLERAEPKENVQEDGSKFVEKYERWKIQVEKVRNMAEIIISKQRHGPIGTIKVHFEGEFTKFSNLQNEDQLPSADY